MRNLIQFIFKLYLRILPEFYHKQTRKKNGHYVRGYDKLKKSVTGCEETSN